MDPVSTFSAAHGAATPASRQPDPLRRVAEAFEAMYLAEMFSHAGLGAPRESFGGGPGEAAFASLLAREWADAAARQGGVGIADQIHRALLGREQRDA